MSLRNGKLSSSKDLLETMRKLGLQQTLPIELRRGMIDSLCAELQPCSKVEPLNSRCSLDYECVKAIQEENALLREMLPLVVEFLCQDSTSAGDRESCPLPAEQPSSDTACRKSSYCTCPELPNRHENLTSDKDSEENLSRRLHVMLKGFTDPSLRSTAVTEAPIDLPTPLTPTGGKDSSKCPNRIPASPGVQMSKLSSPHSVAPTLVPPSINIPELKRMQSCQSSMPDIHNSNSSKRTHPVAAYQYQDPSVSSKVQDLLPCSDILSFDSHFVDTFFEHSTEDCALVDWSHGSTTTSMSLDSPLSDLAACYSPSTYDGSPPTPKSLENESTSVLVGTSPTLPANCKTDAAKEKKNQADKSDQGLPERDFMMAQSFFPPSFGMLPSHLQHKEENPVQLWEFLLECLYFDCYQHIIRWSNKEEGAFKIVDSQLLAGLWGLYKRRMEMNFDKMSRAMRYYYGKGILKKKYNGKTVQRLEYVFKEKSNFATFRPPSYALPGRFFRPQCAYPWPVGHAMNMSMPPYPDAMSIFIRPGMLESAESSADAMSSLDIGSLMVDSPGAIRCPKTQKARWSMPY